MLSAGLALGTIGGVDMAGEAGGVRRRWTSGSERTMIVQSQATIVDYVCIGDLSLPEISFIGPFI